MKRLRLALPVVMMVAWAVGAGCEDDRGAVGIGAGGEITQPIGGSGAGETAALGGAGGAGASAGGAGGAAECPADIFAAEGKACSDEGMVCGDGADDPCQFGQSIVCQAGKWQHQEAFPAPCGGAGGQSNGGAGGAGGADAGGADAAGAGGAP
jgi:hypothetical protein